MDGPALLPAEAHESCRSVICNAATSLPLRAIASAQRQEFRLCLKEVCRNSIARPSSHRSSGEVSGRTTPAAAAAAMQEGCRGQFMGRSVETVAAIELEQLRRLHYEWHPEGDDS